jgi:hypothetical protein
MKLSTRIHELREEIVDAKLSFKALHKEKVRLEKECLSERTKIESWSEKVNELQMLKFGRLIDLDVLEQGSDRSKEYEAEATVALVELEFHNDTIKLTAQLDELRVNFADVSNSNCWRISAHG